MALDEEKRRDRRYVSCLIYFLMLQIFVLIQNYFHLFLSQNL